jgi:hypothetical protein
LLTKQTNQRGLEKLQNRGFVINSLALVAFSLFFFYLAVKVMSGVLGWAIARHSLWYHMGKAWGV